ncbi:MAG: hypothetical protein NC223_05165 [Butyrivibrio sp.]|nr:hypothetical protein [Butyrivibrio sp.]
MSKTYELSRKFIYRNARPLDLARFRYHFEGGSAESVLDALAAYQNEDGGFANGLEPDNWSPYSSPIQVWRATEILREIAWRDAGHPLVSGILDYLESGADVGKHGLWRNTTAPTDNYPHAVWWSYDENGDTGYNPTAALAGFILKYADRESALYRKGLELAHRAFDWLAANAPLDERHVLCCFIRLYEYLDGSSAAAEFDMSLFKKMLTEQICGAICGDVSKWGREYVAVPSTFIETKNSLGYEENKELVKKECELVLLTQEADGGRAVPFCWCTDYKEQEIAYNRWRSDIVIQSERFLREFI